jgi:cell division protein FtsB
MRTKRQIITQTEKLKNLEENLEILKKHVTLLSNNSLDLDLLEERCRIILNYCDSEDVILR